MTKAVRFADPAQQAGFTQLPNVILRDSSLSAGARLTYAMLSSFAWQSDECWVGQKKLGGLVGVGDRAIRNYLTELEKAKLLEINQQGLNKPNHYVLFGSGPDRNAGSGPDRNAGSDKEDSVEEDSTTSDRKQTKVNRKIVTDNERSLATAAVAVFNEIAGTAFTVDAHLAPLVGRIREHPELTVDRHRAIIEAVFAGEHWWGSAPGLQIVYGNAAQFERCCELARQRQKQKDAAEDPNAERERVEREFKEAEDDAG